MVGRDGIEPPTLGFSDLALIAYVVHLLNELLCRSFVDEVAISDGRMHRVAPCE